MKRVSLLLPLTLFRSRRPTPVEPGPAAAAPHLVVILLHEAAQRQTEPLVRPDAPVHGIHGPRRLIFVDLLPLPMQRHGSAEGTPGSGGSKGDTGLGRGGGARAGFGGERRA